jgi:NADP-dependent 3-hydroxy acid dehydrogenase YdfG
MSAARGVAVVSGGGSGIGRALAQALARRGHPLALVGRRRAPLEETLAAAGGAGACYAIDVRAHDGLAGFASRVETAQGPVEVAVAAAGVARVGRFAELAPAAIRESLETNLLGAALLFRELLPAMLARGQGTLVPLLSVAARRVFPEWSAYAASKWGLLGLVESLREELAGSGVRVVALTPGAADTGLWADVPGEWSRERMIPVDAIARALLWALDAGGDASVEEIRIQPGGGNL